MYSDLRTLVRLNEHRVKYLVVGAYAVSVHAQPRATKDIDILVRPTPDNAKASPEAITFSIDKKSYATVTPADLPAGTHWVYNHLFFLLLNLAVGGDWPGNPDNATQFPQSLVVDWVRVWKE